MQVVLVPHDGEARVSVQAVGLPVPVVKAPKPLVLPAAIDGLPEPHELIAGIAPTSVNSVEESAEQTCAGVPASMITLPDVPQTKPG